MGAGTHHLHGTGLQVGQDFPRLLPRSMGIRPSDSMDGVIWPRFTWEIKLGEKPRWRQESALTCLSQGGAAGDGRPRSHGASGYPCDRMGFPIASRNFVR
jgi:hypothetical protein